MSNDPLQYLSVLSQAESTETRTPSELVAAVCDIRPVDRVIVIGRELSEHLIALAHCGCLSATGVTPTARHVLSEGADVVWIAGGNEIDASVMAAVLQMTGARLIAIELAVSATLAPVRVFLRRLRQKGLVHQSSCLAAGRLVITAQRTARLQWAA
jgi:hypothetical protein